MTKPAYIAYIEKQAQCGLHIGDYVEVINAVRRHHPGWDGTWSKEMDATYNCIGTIIHVCNNFGYLVEFENLPLAASQYPSACYFYPYYALRRRTEEEYRNRLRRDPYVPDKGSVKVGDQVPDTKENSVQIGDQVQLWGRIGTIVLSPFDGQCSVSINGCLHLVNLDSLTLVSRPTESSVPLRTVVEAMKQPVHWLIRLEDGRAQPCEAPRGWVQEKKDTDSFPEHIQHCLDELDLPNRPKTYSLNTGSALGRPKPPVYRVERWVPPSRDALIYEHCASLGPKPESWPQRHSRGPIRVRKD